MNTGVGSLLDRLIFPFYKQNFLKHELLFHGFFNENCDGATLWSKMINTSSI